MYHNVEKSVFRADTYVGYGSGYVWRITRRRGGWQAWQDVLVHPDMEPYKLRVLTGRTLKAISCQLESI